MLQLSNFIDGDYLPPSNKKYLDNFDPSRGEVYSTLPDSDEMDVVLAIRAASKAFDSWSQMPIQKRAKFLNDIADVIERRAEEFAEAESRDQGKTKAHALKSEIPRAVWNFRFFASKILHVQEIATNMDGEAYNFVMRHPVGVCGLISPWNLPLYLLTWKIAPAIAAGNTVVCKPSEWTPMTAWMMGEVFKEVGLPKGVVNIVFGLGSKAGSCLVNHPGVKLISFTGGTETGEKILKGAASNFKKVSLELGGKNANIILKDADLKRSLLGTIQSSFLNQGEVCLCGSRVFIQQEIYDEFLNMLKEETDKLIVGDPFDDKTFMGPLVSKTHYDRVLGHIDKMVSDKGEIISGGQKPDNLPTEFQNGYFLRPTIVKNLSECSEMQQTEVFGPVISVMPFKYPLEAVKWANTTPYGLSASVWTQNISNALKVSKELQVGTVWVNSWLKRDLRMPFGGMKASGLGREGGDYSMDFFTEQKTVCMNLK